MLGALEISLLLMPVPLKLLDYQFIKPTASEDIQNTVAYCAKALITSLNVLFVWSLKERLFTPKWIA